MRPLARWPIRARVAAPAVVAITLMLVVVAFAVVLFHRSALQGAIDADLALRADTIERQVAAGLRTLDSPPEDFAMWLDESGAVVGRSTSATGMEAPRVDPAGGEAIRTVTGIPLDDEPFRVLARAIGDGDIVVVGINAERIADSTEALVGSLALTVPLLGVLLGGLIWVLVGRSLAPVDRMTADVDAIGVTELDRRLRHPGTADEVGRLAETLNRMLERIEASADRQRRFVADASHELRSPLTRMRSLLEVHLASEATPDAIADELLDDVTAMQRLTEDLLDLASSDEAAFGFDPRPVDLDDVALRETERLMTRGRVEVDRSGLSAAHVSGDPAQLTRLVRNLLDNAERHASSTVTVALTESEGAAILTVADDGPGVDPRLRGVIFERFARADSARSSSTGGAGLGLAIAREIAERHDGTLRLIGGPPGAVFEVRLPAAG